MAREAESGPTREATVVAIGIHPFAAGMPAGTTTLLRVLVNFKNQKLVWVTDVEAVLAAAGKNTEKLWRTLQIPAKSSTR